MYILLAALAAAEIASSVSGVSIKKHKAASPLQQSKPSWTAALNQESSALVRANTGSKWVFCAQQWQQCECAGNMRWGTHRGDKWQLYTQTGASKIVECNIMKLGDAAPGAQDKRCECLATPGTEYYKGLNPMLVQDSEGDAEGAKIVSSCDIWARDKDSGRNGDLQWQAVEPFCSDTWEETAKKDPALEAGAKSLDLKTMRQLMRARVDKRFVQNYDRLYHNGWLPRAFVNYYAGPVDGKHTKMTEELIRSVHAFSKEPIVVVHYGVSTPASWNASRFPRLILLHADPSPDTGGRSFNFNKLRSYLLARTMTGIGLDSDQFVAPGVDELFNMTEREITKDYGIPIMPVHFLDRKPRDGGRWWHRYCPNDSCPRQSLRWGHAHPTYTIEALPWIGKWLRRNYRDETLGPVDGDESTKLRITDIPEDEDLLNVGMWEDHATKQWCKYDLPGPTEFDALVNWRPDMEQKTTSSNIEGDPRWYKDGGAAKLFYTAHHAVNPKNSASYIATMEQRAKAGTWPSAVVFDRQFWKSGSDLRKAHPELECIA